MGEDDIDYITGVTARGNVPRSRPMAPSEGVTPPKAGPFFARKKNHSSAVVIAQWCSSIGMQYL
jgi:hypothetical protein